jgi:hypothetical protein
MIETRIVRRGDTMGQLACIHRIEGDAPGDRPALAHLTRFRHMRKCLVSNPGENGGRQEVVFDDETMTCISFEIFC